MAEKAKKEEWKARKIQYHFGSRKLAVWRPTEGYPTKEEASRPVEGSLELFYAHGFNGQAGESRQNLHLSNCGNYLIYYIAAVVVVFDYKNNKQKFFRHHNDDITAVCMDRRKDSTKIASGQTDPIDRPGEGKDLPKVWIWDMAKLNADEDSKIELIDKICWGFINKIAWSEKTGYIYVLCGDEDQTLKVFNEEEFKQDYKKVEKRAKAYKKLKGQKAKEKANSCNMPCMLETSTTKESIGGILINNTATGCVDELLLWGKRKFMYGQITKGDKEGKLKSKIKQVSTGKLIKAGEKGYGSAAFLPGGYYAVGAASGHIYIGKQFEAICVCKDAHSKAVGTLFYDELLYTGGFDKKLKTFKLAKDFEALKGKKGKKIGLKEQSSRDISVAGSDMIFLPKAMTFHKGDNTIFAGTKSNQVVQINLDEKECDASVIVDGHDDQVWGLATHPTKNLFVTGGYDNAVKLWNAETLKCIDTYEFENDEKGKKKKKTGKEIVTTAWSNNGKCIACGTEDSNICVFTFDEEKHKLKYQSIIKIPRKTKNAEEENISYIRFSENSKYMGVAHMDSQLYLYTIKYGKKTITLEQWKPMVHSAAPTHVQWSADGKMVKTLTRDYEVVHWKLNFKKKTGKHIPNVPDPDIVKWADDPLVAGWDVQGLYQAEWDGTDLNDATLTSDKKLIMTGDDYGCVRLHNYPAIDRDACIEYGGHAEFVVGVELLRDDSQLISCGGMDCAIFQWKVNRG